MIRWILRDAPCVTVVGAEIDGRAYTADEIAAILQAHAQNAARPMCAPRTHFPDERRARTEGAATWICAAYGCERVRNGNNPYCKMHQQRVVRHGSADVVLRVGRKKKDG